MATPVIMPRQGQSVESCVIGKWHKKKGDTVSVGDVLFTYETDKSTFEEESKAAGVLLEVFYEEGDEVECLKTVCVIGNEGETVVLDSAPSGSSADGRLPGAGAPPLRNSPQTTGIETAAQSFSSVSDDRALHQASADTDDLMNVTAGARGDGAPVSPRARALACKTGADISRAVPTGANGRIIQSDVLRVIADGHHATPAAMESMSRDGRPDGIGSGDRRFQGAVPVYGPGLKGTGIGGRVTTRDIEAMRVSGSPASDSEEIRLSNVRKVTARAMHSSLSEGAQLTLHSSFDATDVFSFRKNLKAREGSVDEATLSPTPAGKITVTDIITFATSRVLPGHRSINAHFLGDSIRLFNSAHIGVAVDTPRGLLVPTIFSANRLTLAELSAQAKSLFEKCRQGSIEPDALKGGTFTISNLGGLGVEMFTPILNPPQTGLLGVCCVIERTKEGKPYPAMGLSLTFDHRALDGADAARFLKDLVQYLEEFSARIATEDISLS